MPSPSPTEVPLSAAQALKEEFVELNGTLPVNYHQWLTQLPDTPRLWLIQSDHFKDAAGFAAQLKDGKTPLARFLAERLSPETAEALAACARSNLACGSLIDSLVNDINAVIMAGGSIYSPDLFDGVVLSAETSALVRQLLVDRQIEILNRLLIEEAFPASIAQVWDTLGGVFAILRTRPRTALCISGGGIRSATFGLGVLQGLARHDLLDSFDYLSTVSGGGYIGSWLSSWMHHTGSPQHVFEEIKNVVVESPSQPEPRPLGHLRTFSNYLTPKLGAFSADTWTLIGTYLRNLFLNWLVFVPLIAAVVALPRLYVALLALPPETWSAGLLLAAGAVFTVVGIAYGALQRPNASERLARYSLFWSRRSRQQDFLVYCLVPLLLGAVCFTSFWAWLPGLTFELPPWWLLACGGGMLHLGGWLISRIVLRQFSLSELFGVLLTGGLGGFAIWLLARDVFTNLSAAPTLELYVCFAAPAFVLVFLLTASLFIGLGSRRTADSDREWWARMGAWLLISVVGWSGFSALAIFGPMGLVNLVTWSPLLTALGGVPGLITLVIGFSSSSEARKGEDSPHSWKQKVLDWVLALAAPLFVLILIALVSLGSTAVLKTWPDLQDLSHLKVVHQTPVWVALLFVASFASFGLLMSWLININKFTLQSVYRNRLIRAYLGASNPRRNPNPFTGFDPHDNLRMSQLSGQRPFHVINMALNLVSGDNLAWQQRKAETFTASALHAGNARLGYRRAKEYAQNEKGQGLSLGTAVTISGAAASPNMGYHSSPVVAALMTLFNIRLGAWLGNPGPAGNHTFRQPAPRSAALHVAKEALGLTNSSSGYVYLSDGGHFENLGLYEMVLRRCQFIVVSDGGCDPECRLEDLGNAIRKIRVDLGVPIEMQRFDIHSRKEGEKGRHCAVGEILYDRVDGPQAKRGVLIYIKPAITGDEPRDVFNYKETSPFFPHEPTGDQWFSESQFESYRMLGAHTVTEMCYQWSTARKHRPEANPLALLARQVYTYLEIPLPSDFSDIADTLPAQLTAAPPSRMSSREETEHETKLVEETQSF